MSTKCLMQDALNKCYDNSLLIHLPQGGLGLALCCHLVALWYHPQRESHNPRSLGFNLPTTPMRRTASRSGYRAVVRSKGSGVRLLGLETWCSATA